MSVLPSPARPELAGRAADQHSRAMSQDYYETLQVHPRADDEAIRAAYQRLRSLYDPARLEGAADDLRLLAQVKLAAIEAAFDVLTDPERRAAYDSELAAAPAAPAPAGAEALPDYRPLPPAGRAERPRRFDHEPVTPQPPARVGLPAALGVLGALLALVVGTSLVIVNWAALTSPAKTAAGPTATVSTLDQYEIAIQQARQLTEQSPNDPQAWIALGNQLYDSAQIVRENMPDSTLYQQRIPRWIEASQAYDKALALQPDNAAVLSDRGTSLCYYGAGMGDQSFVTQGIESARAAAQKRPDDPLIQLNLGSCLVSATPPQTLEALASWQKVLTISPADSPIAQRARELIDKYKKP